MPDDRWGRDVLVDPMDASLILVGDVDVAQGTDTTFAILLESGDFLLTEGSDFILQEVVNA